MVEWSDHCCVVCEAKFKAEGKDVFKEFPIPTDLIAHPEIIRWIQRHEIIYKMLKERQKRSKW